VHALDCFLEQLARRMRQTRRERYIRERAGRPERERVKVKSPFECNDFLGKKNRHTDKYYS